MAMVYLMETPALPLKAVPPALVVPEEVPPVPAAQEEVPVAAPEALRSVVAFQDRYLA